MLRGMRSSRLRRVVFLISSVPSSLRGDGDGEGDRLTLKKWRVTTEGVRHGSWQQDERTIIHMCADHHRCTCVVSPPDTSEAGWETIVLYDTIPDAQFKGMIEETRDMFKKVGKPFPEKVTRRELLRLVTDLASEMRNGEGQLQTE